MPLARARAFSFASMMLVAGAVQGSGAALDLFLRSAERDAAEALAKERARTETSIAKDLRFYEWRRATDSVTQGFATLKARGYDGVLLEVGGVVDALEQPDPVAARDTWRSQMHQLVDAAVANGLRVHAVSGDPGWIDPDRQYVAKLLATEMAAWNASEPTPARFSSFQLDIEPPQDGQYGQRVKAMLRLIEDAASVEGVPPIEVAVPARVAEVEVEDNGRTAAAALGDLARRYGVTVVIMAYRDAADGEDGSIALSEKVRRQLGPNVRVRIAQEVGQPINDVARTTHANKGRVSLVRSLSKLETIFGADPLVEGFDVNDAPGALALT